jgi:hypothetical protein
MTAIFRHADTPLFLLPIDVGEFNDINRLTLCQFSILLCYNNAQGRIQGVRGFEPLSGQGDRFSNIAFLG